MYLVFSRKDPHSLLHLLILSTIYLDKYKLMDIQFIVWVFIQYRLISILKLSQSWLLGAPSMCSWAPLPKKNYQYEFIFIFEPFLHFILGSSFIFSAPILEALIYSRVPDFFCWSMVTEAKIWY